MTGTPSGALLSLLPRYAPRHTLRLCTFYPQSVRMHAFHELLGRCLIRVDWGRASETGRRYGAVRQPRASPALPSPPQNVVNLLHATCYVVPSTWYLLYCI